MFDPNKHMMKLKGKDYLEVKWRIVWFREEHADWQIETEIIEADDNHAIFKASISEPTTGNTIATGHGSESKKDFADFLEKAETKAIGRALAYLGYGTQFAPELEEGERIVDAPVERKHKIDKRTQVIGYMAKRGEEYTNNVLNHYGLVDTQTMTEKQIEELYNIIFKKG